MKTILEVTEYFVEPPLAYGAKAFVDRRALFSSFSRARSWVSRSIKEYGPSDSALHYFRLDKILLDKEHGLVLSAVIDGDDRRRGTTAPVDLEAPWRGRALGTCKYKAGDLVAFVGFDPIDSSHFTYQTHRDRFPAREVP